MQIESPKPKLCIFCWLAYRYVRHWISGWRLTYPTEKHESQLGLLFRNIWKNKKCSKPPTRYKYPSVLARKYYSTKGIPRMGLTTSSKIVANSCKSYIFHMYIYIYHIYVYHIYICHIYIYIQLIIIIDTYIETRCIKNSLWYGTAQHVAHPSIHILRAARKAMSTVEPTPSRA